MSRYEMCDDNRFKVIKELKEYIIKATNIETSPKEMEVLDDICFRLWQLGLTLETKRKLNELKNDIELNEAQIDDLTLEVANYKHALEEKNEIIIDLKEDLRLTTIERTNCEDKWYKEHLKVCELEKENQELIVNKNVAQAVAFDQKREIGELKDQISYLKEDGEEWQSAYEWSQTENSILKLENEELKTTLLEYKAQENLYWNTATNNVNLREENEKLKKAIEILSNYICVRNPLDEEDTYYLSALFSNEEIDKQTHDLLKEVLGDE